MVQPKETSQLGAPLMPSGSAQISYSLSGTVIYILNCASAKQHVIGIFAIIDNLSDIIVYFFTGGHEHSASMIAVPGIPPWLMSFAARERPLSAISAIRSRSPRRRWNCSVPCTAWKEMWPTCLPTSAGGYGRNAPSRSSRPCIGGCSRDRCAADSARPPS